MNKDDVKIFIQARTNSTRFPNKAMAELGGKPMLEILLEEASYVSEPLLLIPKDDPLKEWADSKWNYFEGPEKDVLGRFYLAAKEHKPNYILRLTGDCPLITASMIREYISFCKPDFYQDNRLGMADGFDMQIFSFGFLEYCYYAITDSADREHVCSHWTKYKSKKYSVDTEEEYKFVKGIYETRKIVKG